MSGWIDWQRRVHPSAVAGNGNFFRRMMDGSHGTSECAFTRKQYHRQLIKLSPTFFPPQILQIVLNSARRVVLNVIDYDPEFGMGDHMFNDLHFRGIPRLNIVIVSRWTARSVTLIRYGVAKELLAVCSSEEGRRSAAGKHQGRKLDWDRSIGTATLKARFSSATKELTVSLYQAVVLLLFNESVELGYKRILEATRMDEGKLRRTLQSLACAKKKVLRKRPVGKDIDETYVFYVNSEFTVLRVKVHINSIQAKERPEESTRTQSHIDSDRKHYLDAAIVRIMKAKKELTYEQHKTRTIESVKSHSCPR
ncbi:hypothetical protein EDC04DRAFT_3148369 [Pisolithus marmoratus]|nr:hypothetical protein EDC04DRAFT_3148369 [Pisolithus marmoratus]